MNLQTFDSAHYKEEMWWERQLGLHYVLGTKHVCQICCFTVYLYASAIHKVALPGG